MINIEYGSQKTKHSTNIIEENNDVVQSFTAVESKLYHLGFEIELVNPTARQFLEVIISDGNGNENYSKVFELKKINSDWLFINRFIYLNKGKRYFISFASNGNTSSGIRLKFGYRTHRKELFLQRDNERFFGELNLQLGLSNEELTEYFPTHKQSGYTIVVCCQDVYNLQEIVNSVNMPIFVIDNSHKSLPLIQDIIKDKKNITLIKNDYKMSPNECYDSAINKVETEYVMFCESKNTQFKQSDFQLTEYVKDFN